MWKIIMRLRGWKKLAVISLFMLLTGCSATTTFSSYPQKIAPLQEHLTRATPPDFLRLLKTERRSRDKILYNLEHGRLAQLFGRNDVSRADFAAAIDAIRNQDQRAVISVGQISANMASMATNDNAIPYSGEGYERVFLHHYQALNYLLRSDLTGAGVEFRWANTEQQDALSRHEQELLKAENEAQKNDVNDWNDNFEFQRRYAQLDEIAGRIKNSFQNAYSFYLSGLVYELQGEENDAYIDYKKALEIYPENTYLQQDVLRLAGRLQMNDDLAELAERFPSLDNGHKLRSVDEGAQGELILLYEEDFVPPREELKLAFFIPDGAVTLSFPYYRGPWRTFQGLEILSAGQSLGKTELLCDVRALAVKSLQEKMPILLTRQVVRMASKILAQHAVREKLGSAGEFGMMLYSILSENADLRSWLTLPANAQILRVTLPAGRQRLRLQSAQSLSGTDLDVNIVDRGKTLVYAVKTGNQFHTNVAVFFK